MQFKFVSLSRKNISLELLTIFQWSNQVFFFFVAGSLAGAYGPYIKASLKQFKQSSHFGSTFPASIVSLVLLLVLLLLLFLRDVDGDNSTAFVVRTLGDRERDRVVATFPDVIKGTDSSLMLGDGQTRMCYYYRPSLTLNYYFSASKRYDVRFSPGDQDLVAQFGVLDLFPCIKSSIN